MDTAGVRMPPVPEAGTAFDIIPAGVGILAPPPPRPSENHRVPAPRNASESPKSLAELLITAD